MKLFLILAGIIFIVAIGIAAYISYQNRPVKQVEKAFKNGHVPHAITMFYKIEKQDDIALAQKIAREYADTIVSSYISDAKKNTRADYEDVMEPLAEISIHILKNDEKLQNQMDLIMDTYSARMA